MANQGIRGIRQTIPSGYMIGRQSPGSSKGAPGLIPLPPLNQQPIIAGSGGKATQGGSQGGGGSSSAAIVTIAAGTGINVTGAPAYTIALQVPVTVADGGTNATSASGTSLDNITGFSSTGILKRTGAGTYIFIADGQLPATATNDDAAAGKLGEYISATANGVSQSDGTVTNLTTISLTAGDWDVHGSITYLSASAVLTDGYACVSTTTLDASQTNMLTAPWARLRTTPGSALPTDYLALSATPPPLRVSITTNTTVYLVAFCKFASGAVTAFGSIQARRVR